MWYLKALSAICKRRTSVSVSSNPFFDRKVCVQQEEMHKCSPNWICIKIFRKMDKLNQINQSINELAITNNAMKATNQAINRLHQCRNTTTGKFNQSSNQALGPRLKPVRFSRFHFFPISPSPFGTVGQNPVHPAGGFRRSLAPIDCFRRGGFSRGTAAWAICYPVLGGCWGGCWGGSVLAGLFRLGILTAAHPLCPGWWFLLASGIAGGFYAGRGAGHLTRIVVFFLLVSQSY